MMTELKSANSAKVGKIFKDARNNLELSKNDIAEDDWTEFNLYLGVFRLTWRYF